MAPFATTGESIMKYSKLYPLIIGATLLAACGTTFGDDDDEGESRFWRSQPGVAPVTDASYKNECGACHFPYQPGLLPERSWRKLMAGLDNHFGDNAEMAPEENKKLLDYLVSNSADKSSHRRSQKINRSIAPSVTPLRITDVPYIQREHREIPQRLISGNDKVKSLSQCNACHQSIESGSFSERQIKIPGYGRWDD
jgi:hypothetical protein